MQCTHKDMCNNHTLPHPTTPLGTLTHKTPPQHTLAGNSWTTSDFCLMSIVLGLLDTPSYILWPEDGPAKGPKHVVGLIINVKHTNSCVMNHWNSSHFCVTLTQQGWSPLQQSPTCLLFVLGAEFIFPCYRTAVQEIRTTLELDLASRINVTTTVNCYGNWTLGFYIFFNIRWRTASWSGGARGGLRRSWHKGNGLP